jgi:hypothetical protein
VSKTLSADEVRAANVAAMGAELGELFTALSFELTWLFLLWKQYLMLYGGKQTRLDLINQAAPFFFGLMQGAIWDDTLLSITRLTGPEDSMGKKNLTVRRLPALIGDARLSSDTKASVDSLVEKAAFAFDRRNRYLAHRDLALSLGKPAKPIPNATREQIGEILDGIADLLNRIEQHYCRSTTAYRTAPVNGDAESLLYVIRDGLRREELRQQRLEETGEYHPKDWDDDAPPI